MAKALSLAVVGPVYHDGYSHGYWIAVDNHARKRICADQFQANQRRADEAASLAQTCDLYLVSCHKDFEALTTSTLATAL